MSLSWSPNCGAFLLFFLLFLLPIHILMFLRGIRAHETFWPNAFLGRNYALDTDTRKSTLCYLWSGLQTSPCISPPHIFPTSLFKGTNPRRIASYLQPWAYAGASTWRTCPLPVLSPQLVFLQTHAPLDQNMIFLEIPSWQPPIPLRHSFLWNHLDIVHISHLALVTWNSIV